jgi:Na+/H+ antiporter NhaD/arsenite permease-like protein
MTLAALPLVLFGATYLLLAIGRIPGLALDRTGFAVLGALAFLATGEITLDEAKTAIDAPTLTLLFSMMLLSAQYQMSGLYGAIGRRLARMESPRRLLAGVLVVSALLAAVLTNDVVCFALTPLLCAALLATRLDPLPYLLALACGTNIGSALTPIGNPQNILISQQLGLAFLPFVLACALPVAAALAFTFWFLARRLRERQGAALERPSPEISEAAPEPALDRREAAKAIVLTVAAIALFLTPVPAYLTGCALAGIVLTSRRMHSRTMLGLVDWQMLALFVALFIVTRGLELSGWTEAGQRALAEAGLPLAQVGVLVPVVALLGNLVGNVPAVMLLLRFVPAEPAQPVVGYALALASTFAGNALLIGSVANLIVVEQAARLGIRIGFRDHLRVGLPVTFVSLAAAIAMLAWPAL